MNALWSNVCVALPAAHYHRIPRNCKKIALGTTTQRREDSCKILSSFSPFFLLSCSGKSNDFERSKMERNQIAGCSVSRFFCTNTIFCKSKLASSMTAADNLNSQNLARKVVKKNAENWNGRSWIENSKKKFYFSPEKYRYTEKWVNDFF